MGQTIRSSINDNMTASWHSVYVDGDCNIFDWLDENDMIRCPKIAAKGDCFKMHVYFEKVVIRERVILNVVKHTQCIS